MASCPITSWQIDGEKLEAVTDFILGVSKITADGDCSHKIKRCLLLGRKAMANRDSTLESRDITLLTKVHIVLTLPDQNVRFMSSGILSVLFLLIFPVLCKEAHDRCFDRYLLIKGNKTVTQI